jgi:Skp family chaperone for outer membrane proteins
MRKLIYLTILALAPAAAGAQDATQQLAPQQAQPQQQYTQAAQPKFGYLSYSKALEAMPDYAVAKKNLESLRAQYEAETKRSEDEFNAKYEDFLDVQKELDTPILRKRQSELQDLLHKSVSFKREAERLLKQAEADMYAPLRKRLDDILRKIATEHRRRRPALRQQPLRRRHNDAGKRQFLIHNSQFIIGLLAESVI